MPGARGVALASVNVLGAFAFAILGVTLVVGGHAFVGLATLAFALGFAVVAVRAAAGGPPAPRVRPALEVEPLADPPRDALADLPWPTPACPACGYLDLWLRGRWASEVECPRCGYLGAPGIYDDPDAFLAHLSALRAARAER